MSVFRPDKCIYRVSFYIMKPLWKPLTQQLLKKKNSECLWLDIKSFEPLLLHLIWVRRIWGGPLIETWSLWIKKLRFFIGTQLEWNYIIIVLWLKPNMCVIKKSGFFLYKPKFNWIENLEVFLVRIRFIKLLSLSFQWCQIQGTCMAEIFLLECNLGWQEDVTTFFYAFIHDSLQGFGYGWKWIF